MLLLTIGSLYLDLKKCSNQLNYQFGKIITFSKCTIRMNLLLIIESILHIAIPNIVETC